MGALPLTAVSGFLLAGLNSLGGAACPQGTPTRPPSRHSSHLLLLLLLLPLLPACISPALLFVPPAFLLTCKSPFSARTRPPAWLRCAGGGRGYEEVVDVAPIFRLLMVDRFATLEESIKACAAAFSLRYVPMAI